MKFVSLGVPTKIVVIFDDEDFRVRTGRAIKPRSGQSADTPPNNDKIVMFARIHQARGMIPEIAVAQRMRRLESARMAAAHSLSRGRVIALGVLCLCLGGSRQFGGKPTHGCSNRHALEHVPSGNRPAHAQFSIRFLRHPSIPAGTAPSLARPSRERTPSPCRTQCGMSQMRATP